MPRARAARAELRVRPQVQGAALVLDNKTGRILAMAGGFSYPLSQLNRTTQSQRQPGSALKPLTYLTALQKGLQPNTLVRDQEITLPPIGGGIAREQDYWTPKNYDGGEWGVITLRRALENSQQPGDRQPAGWRHRYRSRTAASIASARWRSRRRSTANACRIIPSCSARSRCGRSTSRRSMPRSPMKACGRRPMRSNRSSTTG